MRSTLFFAFSAVLLISVTPVPTYAETKTVDGSFTVTCGIYKYDVTRFVDGLDIRVTDGSRVRTFFYKDFHLSPSVDISEACQGGALPIVTRLAGKYGGQTDVELLDPTHSQLQLSSFGGMSWGYAPAANGYEYLYSPVEKTNEIKAILDSQVVIEVSSTKLLSKVRSTQPATILSDRSYYTYNAKSVVTKKISTSSWGTTMAVASKQCGSGLYTLYEKKFADSNTLSSTAPASQFIIERSSGSVKKYIPVPYPERGWNEWSKWNVSIADCLDNSVSVFVTRWGMMKFPSGVSSDQVDRFITVASEETSYVRYWDPKMRITETESVFNDGQGLYTRGRIFLTDAGEINGDTVIRTLNANGTVTLTRPPFFQDLKQYGYGAAMEFVKDPYHREHVAVILRVYNKEAGVLQYRYFTERDGIYTEFFLSTYEWNVWKYAGLSSGPQFTDLYVSHDPATLTVRSYFLKKPMLLHDFGSASFTLNWYVVGPADADGSRVIWYSFTVNGRAQTWKAVVR